MESARGGGRDNATAARRFLLALRSCAFVLHVHTLPSATRARRSLTAHRTPASEWPAASKRQSCIVQQRGAVSAKDGARAKKTRMPMPKRMVRDRPRGHKRQADRARAVAARSEGRRASYPARGLGSEVKQELSAFALEARSSCYRGHHALAAWYVGFRLVRSACAEDDRTGGDESIKFDFGDGCAHRLVFVGPSQHGGVSLDDDLTVAFGDRQQRAVASTKFHWGGNAGAELGRGR